MRDDNRCAVMMPDAAIKVAARELRGGPRSRTVRAPAGV